jgi:hypothetical protein
MPPKKYNELDLHSKMLVLKAIESGKAYSLKAKILSFLKVQ